MNRRFGTPPLVFTVDLHHILRIDYYFWRGIHRSIQCPWLYRGVDHLSAGDGCSHDVAPSCSRSLCRQLIQVEGFLVVSGAYFGDAPDRRGDSYAPVRSLVQANWHHLLLSFPWSAGRWDDLLRVAPAGAAQARPGTENRNHSRPRILAEKSLSILGRGASA